MIYIIHCLAANLLHFFYIYVQRIKKLLLIALPRYRFNWKNLLATAIPEMIPGLSSIAF
jgi:hypothetical protein